MKKFFFSLRDNIFIYRIYEIRNSIISYSVASFLDIILILYISSIFQKISDSNFDGQISFYFFQCLFFILLRTFCVLFLRKYSFNKIFYKKLKDEEFLVRNFVEYSIKNSDNENNLNFFKEKLINSCNLAAVNFDIPVASIFSELTFAFGGIIILLKIFGLRLFLYNFPILVILLIASRFLSNKLHKLGSEILHSTEKRLNSIDNVSEIAFEVSSLKKSNKLVDYFSKINDPYNKILSQQIITSNMTQIFTESSAFIIILISLIGITLNTSSMSLTNSATSLAVLSRMIPSFTRSIAFFTQLQFGVPCVKRLSKIKKF
tara:strand:- start:440 stop:1393 length:954 start_codon:yes stop_codon:yes gene_type:complete